MIREVRNCLNEGVVLSVTDTRTMLAHVQVRSYLVEEVKQLQQEDFSQRKKTQVEQELSEGFRMDDDGTLGLNDRLVVPLIRDIQH